MFQPNLGHQKCETSNYCQTNTNGKEGFVCNFLQIIRVQSCKLPVPKGRTVTAKFYKNVVLRKIEETKMCHPKTGLKHLRLLHDNAPAHKAHLVTKFLESEKVTVLPHPPFSPDLAPCNYFLFPKLKYHLSGKRYNLRNALGSAVYQYLMGVPIEEYENCFQKWIDQLKRCIQVDGEYFEGQSKSK